MEEYLSIISRDVSESTSNLTNFLTHRSANAKPIFRICVSNVTVVMIIDRGSLALKKQKSHSMLTRLNLSVVSGLFTYGILLSAYVNDFTQ